MSFEGEWLDKYDALVKPYLQAVGMEHKPGVAANYLVESIRVLQFNELDINTTNVKNELNSKAIDITLFEHDVYKHILENAITYYVEWENLTDKEKYIIKEYRVNKFKERYGYE